MKAKNGANRALVCQVNGCHVFADNYQDSTVKKVRAKNTPTISHEYEGARAGLQVKPMLERRRFAARIKTFRCFVMV